MYTEKVRHDKAIRLIDGGIVEVDGLCVRLIHRPYIVDPCFDCEMDSLCHLGSDICRLCMECDSITGELCFLKLE